MVGGGEHNPYPIREGVLKTSFLFHRGERHSLLLAPALKLGGFLEQGAGKALNLSIIQGELSAGFDRGQG